MHYAIVDIETTGGSPKASKITEIAIYKHNGKEIIDEFISLINPEMKIPEFIIRLTGISDRMVENSPKFYEVAKKIIEFTEDCVFVAHNVGFDYGILRQEFKWLGYDYRKPHLCTVRASRHVLPGHESYSLGKLSRKLGIEIKGRHRAGGDALATAHLFTILHDTDKTNLHSFIQEEINPRILHPNLNVDALDEIPSKTGVYKFFNEDNQLIYIGKSKQIRTRIDQHLRNTSSKKGMQMMKEISRIEYELTGSELIALMLESQLIKQHRPLFNRQLTKSRFPFGIYDTISGKGYLQLEIERTAQKESIPLISFTTRVEASKYLEYICEQYELCQKLCSLYPTQSSCFHYEIKKCKGACIEEETTTEYNERAQSLIDKLTFSGESFYVIDKGRNKGEKSLVLVERGLICGFGYAPFHFQNQPVYKWSRFIEHTKEDRDARTILNQFLKKNSEIQVIRF
jgi:DNA polymerase-3 subunit epsilon